MANLLSELERFEQEMKDLGSEPSSSSSLLPPPHLVARVPLPPQPPPPPPPSQTRISPTLSPSPTLPLHSNTNGPGNLPRPPPPPSIVPASVRPLPPRPPPALVSPSGTLPPPPPLSLTSLARAPMSWLNSGATAVASSSLPSTPIVPPQYTYSQPPTSFTSTPSVPPSAQPAVSASSASYFPVPFHLQQQPQPYQQTQQFQQQSYQQGPVQYSAQATAQSQPQVTQPAAVPAATQPTYQYQAGYQPSPAVVTATAATPAPEIFAMPQQQQAQQLFQRDAQTITPEALESVKAALASGEGEHKSEARKRAVPRKAAGLSWEDPTLADWPENDHRLFCGDLGNEVNDEVLTKAFTRFASFNMARVVRDKRTGKTKGYGFVSFANPSDLALAFKEMNGKYVGNRPIKLRKSTWKERTDMDAFEKQKNSKRQKSKKSLLHK
ncbi:unnamed protein product [Calypogeia fissa]